MSEAAGDVRPVTIPRIGRGVAASGECVSLDATEALAFKEQSAGRVLCERTKRGRGTVGIRCLDHVGLKSKIVHAGDGRYLSACSAADRRVCVIGAIGLPLEAVVVNLNVERLFYISDGALYFHLSVVLGNFQ